MTYFVIGDNHFGDARILRYCRNDKFSTVDEMNRYMIEKWNKTVKRNDTVFINGQVVTVNQKNDVVEALAIKDKK